MPSHSKLKSLLILLGVLVGCAFIVGPADSLAAAEGAPPVDPAAFSSYVAQVDKVADGAITITSYRGHSGNINTINPDEKTVVVLAGKPAKIADLKPEQWIRVHWNYGEDKKTQKIIKIEDAEAPPMMRK